MSALQKLQLLHPASQVEAGEYGYRLPFQNVDHGIVLTKAMLPNGKAIPLLKSVLTSCCENDCLYCPIRKGRDFRRVSFQPEEYARLADRVSINLEAPNVDRLSSLAPQKNFFIWLLQSTQMLHHQLGLARAYFSPFKPQPDTPLESHDPLPLKRELRLYQADFLIRDYGFSQEELVFDPCGNLPLACDPKLAWARRYLAQQPLEVNRADRDQLLRVPGIGLKAAESILSSRKHAPIRELASLEKMGIRTRQLCEFVLLDGKTPPRQPDLFPWPALIKRTCQTLSHAL